MKRLSIQAQALMLSSLVTLALEAGCQAEDTSSTCDRLTDYAQRCDGLSMCEADYQRSTCTNTLAATYRPELIKLLGDCTPPELGCDDASKSEQDSCPFRQLPSLTLSPAYTSFLELACERCPTFGDPGGDPQRCRERKSVICPDDDCAQMFYADSVYQKAGSCLMPMTGTEACMAIPTCLKQALPIAPPNPCN